MASTVESPASQPSPSDLHDVGSANRPTNGHSAPTNASDNQASSPSQPHQSDGEGKSPVDETPPSLREVLNSWILELFAAALAIGILICEVVLLVYYNGKFLPQHWPHSWTINSVFAFLTTLFEVSIMFYVTACIGQLRWRWFSNKEHRLDWLDIMTGASRPSGAMKLLVRKGSQRQVAALGALIVIFVLGINTFTQQVIGTRPGPYSLGFGLASIPANKVYPVYQKGPDKHPAAQEPAPQMVAAISSGFYEFASFDGSSLFITPWIRCGHNATSCHFGTYQSLAVCSQREELTALNPCQSGNCTDNDYYTLPTSTGVNLTLSATRGLINLTSDAKYPTSPALASAVGPLIVRSHAMVARGYDEGQLGKGATAIQCAAWWCAATYTSNYTAGQLFDEKVIEKYTNRSAGARTKYLQDEDIVIRPPRCPFNETGEEDHCEFVVHKKAQAGLQNYLASSNNSYGRPPFISGSLSYHGPLDNRTFNATTPVAGLFFAFNATTSNNVLSFKYAFKFMAEAMTVSVRVPIPQFQYDYYTHPVWTFGTAFRTESLFHVEWGWIAYPIALLVASLIFFFATIILTRNNVTWKSSILPIIFHSFGGDDHVEFAKLDSVKEMKKASGSHKAFLDRQNGGTLLRAGSIVAERKLGYEVKDKVADLFGNAEEIADEVVTA